MLKSGGRTNEVPVMGTEGWPPVDCMQIALFGRFRDCEYDQKGRSPERSGALCQRRRKEKILSVDNLRHMEYYGIQEVFDDLYARAKDGEYFTDLMELILS